MLAQLATIHSTLLRDELATFVEKENGSTEADEGCFDDRVIALALAIYVSKTALLYQTSEGQDFSQRNQDPFLLDNIIKELVGRRSQVPISTYLETEH